MTATHEHRDQVQIASGLNVLAGCWLIISAYAIFQPMSLATNSLFMGLAVALMATCRAFGAYGQSWLSWLNAAIGAWVIASPWALTTAPTDALMANNCFTGMAILLLGTWSALATDTERQYEVQPRYEPETPFDGGAHPSFG